MENLQRNQHSPEFTQAQIAGEQQRFMLQVYLWMCFGLSVTGLIAMFVSQTPAIYQAIMGNNILFFGLIIAELVCVFYLVAMVEKMSAFAAQGTLFTFKWPHFLSIFCHLYPRIHCLNLLYNRWNVCCHELLWLCHQKRS